MKTDLDKLNKLIMDDIPSDTNLDAVVTVFVRHLAYIYVTHKENNPLDKIKENLIQIFDEQINYIEENIKNV